MVTSISSGKDGTQRCYNRQTSLLAYNLIDTSPHSKLVGAVRLAGKMGLRGGGGAQCEGASKGENGSPGAEAPHKR